MASFLILMVWVFLMGAWMNAYFGTGDKYFVLWIAAALICALWVGFERIVWAIRKGVKSE